ncbi:MAG: hypothetical protein KatS3mg103_1404 [Phycisphaerales bacterium]|nr:MAG: hypothetical protein KatS3mg103_1404 [Phycisphaerales bacterium]
MASSAGGRCPRTAQPPQGFWLAVWVAALAVLAGPALVARALAQPMGLGGSSVSTQAVAWWPDRQAEQGPLVAVVAVTLDHAPGLKSWPSAEQDVLPPEIAELAIRTEVALASTDQAVLGVGPIQWPTPKPYPVPAPTGVGTVEVPVYTGTVVVYVPVLIERSAADQPRTLEVRVGYQVCDEALCYPPETVTLRASLPAVGQGQPPALAAGLLPSTLDAAIAQAVTHPAADADRPGIAPGAAEPAPTAPSAQPDQSDQPADPSASRAPRSKFLGVVPVPSPESLGGAAVVVLLGVVGGMVLNLTPCVLPVIPIKVLTLSQHAGSPGKTLALGLWMALGVVAFWVGLGIPAALLGKAVGAIFGVWWFTVGVGAIIALLALGLMGLFTVQLPQSVYKINPKADTPWGSFVFGVMTGVLGLPCFGLVAGALLVSAAEIPPTITLLIFTAIGVGMALPYLVLSMNPRWVNALPRTGPASELVKQVMGLLLLAAGAYFVASGLQALVLDQPWIGRQLHWWAAAVFVALACVWLAYRTFQITPSLVRRAVFLVLAVAVGGLALGFAAQTTERARQDYQERARQVQAEGGDGQAGLLTTAWMDYQPGLIERAQQAGYVVVVDFTADWCLNCKALKAAVLEAEPVRSRLRQDDVVMVKADLTSSGQPGWALMQPAQAERSAGAGHLWPGR